MYSEEGTHEELSNLTFSGPQLSSDLIALPCPTTQFNVLFSSTILELYIFGLFTVFNVVQTRPVLFSSVMDSQSEKRTDLQKLKFPKKLVVMLRRESCMQRCGSDGFQVTDWENFKRIMPKYFMGTTKVESFKRQLNIYNFDRMTGEKDAWRHDHFVVGDHKEIELIVRVMYSKRQNISPRMSVEKPPPDYVRNSWECRPMLYRLKKRPRIEAPFCPSSKPKENLTDIRKATQETTAWVCGARVCGGFRACLEGSTPASLSENNLTTPTTPILFNNDDSCETDILPPGKQNFSFVLEPQKVKLQHSLIGIELDHRPVLLPKSFSNSYNDLPDVL